MGTAFTLDHCWSILHHSPKWQETIDELSFRTRKDPKRLPSTLPSSEPNSVKATTDEDEADNGFESLGSSRPEGRKATKQKKQDDAELREGQRELIKISKEKMLAMQIVADDVVMSKDLTGMDEASRKYYETKKAEILKRSGIL